MVGQGSWGSFQAPKLAAINSDPLRTCGRVPQSLPYHMYLYQRYRVEERHH